MIAAAVLSIASLAYAKPSSKRAGKMADKQEEVSKTRDKTKDKSKKKKADKTEDTNEEESKRTVYSVATLKGACEYLLAKAIACEPEICLKDLDRLTAEELKQLKALLGEYRLINSVSAYTDGEVLVLEPDYKSCVRMLKEFRDENSIDLTPVERAALEAAKRLLNELEIDSMDRCGEKAQTIHDWIVANCSYDMAGLTQKYSSPSPDSYSPYDGKFMLLEKTGVCDSYAQAYWLLLQMSDVPCSMMAGVMLDNGQPHAWNLVYLDDHWAHVDTTHDDPVPDEPGRICEDYYDKTDKEMAKNREWVKELFPNSEFTELFSSDNELMSFNTVQEFVTFVRQQELGTDMEYTIQVAELERRSDFDASVQDAAEKAMLNGRISSTQDPLFPKAIRVKFHENSEIEKH